MKRIDQLCFIIINFVGPVDGINLYFGGDLVVVLPVVSEQNHRRKATQTWEKHAHALCVLEYNLKCFSTLSRMNLFRYGIYPWLETGPSSSSLKCSSSATGSCGIFITVHKLWDSTWKNVKRLQFINDYTANNCFHF